MALPPARAAPPPSVAARRGSCSLSVAHLAKGLDFEEAGLSLLLLVALLRYRKRFDVPGDPRSVRPLLHDRPWRLVVSGSPSSSTGAASTAPPAALFLAASSLFSSFVRSTSGSARLGAR